MDGSVGPRCSVSQLSVQAWSQLVCYSELLLSILYSCASLEYTLGQADSSALEC